MDIGENIKKIRKEKQITQAQLATNAGLSEISIRKYESGERKPKLETIKKLASGLSVYIADILGDDFSEYIGEMKNDFNPEDYVSPEYPIAFPGLEYKASEIGYHIRYTYNNKSEDYSNIIIDYPDGASLPVSISELESLNAETDIYLKFRLEELRIKNNTSTQK